MEHEGEHLGKKIWFQGLLDEETNTPKYSRKSKYGIAMGITLTMVLVVLAVIGIVSIITATEGESKKTPLIIIDTDVGNDDMMAISIMLDKHIRGDVKIVGITTVNGMMDAYNGSIAVLELLQTFGLEKDIEVHTGTELRVNASIGHYFNETAWWIVSSPSYYNFSEILHFDNITETELNSLTQGSSAIDYLLSKSSKSDAKETTILCLGPLSNFGFALEQSPDMISKFKKVVFMGGAVVVQGNAPNNVSEWNFYADGEAANLVFSGLGENQPAYLCGLEVANYYTLNSTQIESLLNASSVESQQSSSYSVPLMWTYLLSALPASCAFDPVAATDVVYEEPFQFEKMNVQVSTEPGSEGETIDCGNETGSGIAQINVAIQLDITLYFDFLMDIADGSK